MKYPPETWIVKLRENYWGFTQKDLAQLMGVSANTLARWERGERKMPELAKNFVRLMVKTDLK
jgi:DNA-binding transcriptional regulator YiaG